MAVKTNAVRLVEQAGIPCRESFYEYDENDLNGNHAAKAIGMQVHVGGHLPMNPQQRKLLAAIGAETLTNAVRHAGAKQLWIDVEETDAAYVIRYTNDGATPIGAITEGGGLSTARRKIEAAGGQMRIETEPRFAVVIIFEKGVTMDV
jgi:signal transduction histidine kinase